MWLLLRLLAIHHDKKKLKCVHRITAGDNKKILLKTGAVARIFTGACMPKNSNSIVMQENTSSDENNNVLLKKCPKRGENCRLLGEDVAIGDKIIKAGEERYPTIASSSGSLWEKANKMLT